MKTVISQPTPNDTLNIALDTITIGKQALIFIGTKQGAEKTAEEISKKITTNDSELDTLSLDVLHALSKPTKQCERLAKCIKKGIAFHHSGLAHQQRSAIESAFKQGKVRIICCTPTLAAGLDLPAFRAVIRDLKRFGNDGMNWIPVLEYLQMSGRAGRPKYDSEGQAIIVSGTDRRELFERYILGEPESIFSKLAVEPALRACLLSLIATRFITNTDDMKGFFSKTFWAHQYGDMKRLGEILDRILGMLQDWGFVEGNDDFMDADNLQQNRLKPTIVGRRVAELYLDPLTAHHLLVSMGKSATVQPFPWLMTIALTLEMRPLLRATSKDYDDVQEKLLENDGKLLQEEPSIYEDEYEEFLNAAKTAMFMGEWIDEKDEDYLFEKFRIRPGEVHAKLDKADWLLFSAIELAKLNKKMDAARELSKLRVRVKYGAKEELFPLLKLKGIGRARARRLFAHGIKDLGAVRKAQKSEIANVIGDKIADDIKQQVSTDEQCVISDGLGRFQ